MSKPWLMRCWVEAGVELAEPAYSRSNECQTSAISNRVLRPLEAILAFCLVKHRVSDNVGGVKHFSSTLQHALREERHFALMDGVAFPTVDSLLILSRSLTQSHPYIPPF